MPPSLLAVDGRVETTWSDDSTARPTGWTSCRVRRSRPWRSMSFSQAESPSGTVEVTVDGDRSMLGSINPANCLIDVVQLCTVSVDVNESEASQLAITDAGEDEDVPLQIAEVRLDDQAARWCSRAGQCVDLGLGLDDAAVPIGSEEESPSCRGGAGAVRACETPVLEGEAPVHLRRPVRRGRLDPRHREPLRASEAGPTDAPRVEVLDRSDTAIRLRLDGEGDVLLRSGNAYAAGWRATSEAADVSGTMRADTQAAWVVSLDGPAEVEISLRAQRPYRASVVVDWLYGADLCPGRSVGEPIPPRSTASQEERGPWPADVALVVGALRSGVPWARCWPASLSSSMPVMEWIDAASPSSPCARSSHGGLHVPPLGPQLAPLHFGWAEDRLFAHAAARAGAVLLLVVLILFGRSERLRPPAARSARATAAEPQRSHWSSAARGRPTSAGRHQSASSQASRSRALHGRRSSRAESRERATIPAGRGCTPSTARRARSHRQARHVAPGSHRSRQRAPDSDRRSGGSVPITQLVFEPRSGRRSLDRGTPGRSVPAAWSTGGKPTHSTNAPPSVGRSRAGSTISSRKCATSQDRSQKRSETSLCSHGPTIRITSSDRRRRGLDARRPDARRAVPME